jgi:hypothetical protein
MTEAWPEKKTALAPCQCTKCLRTLVERYCLEPGCQCVFYSGHAPECRHADTSHKGHETVPT